MVFNDTNPQVELSINPSSGTTGSFVVSIKEINEIDISGAVVESINTIDVKFNLNQSQFGANTRRTYYAELENGAFLDIVVSCKLIILIINVYLTQNMYGKLKRLLQWNSPK